MMQIELIPLLKDNYAYLLVDDDGTVGVVDPSTAEPVQRLLDDRGLSLDYVINTHHHWDHTGGNAVLKKHYGCHIVGPASDFHRIEGIDTGLRDGECFKFGSSDIRILETPGHTTGHICLFVPDAKALFCGDTLFSMGCGRLFEGTAEQMWESFAKITALPDDTRIFCGHEYTQANGKFCLSIEPDNRDLRDRMREVNALRKEGRPTIPSTLETEKKTNIFLRAGSAARFAEIRTLKDAA